MPSPGRLRRSSLPPSSWPPRALRLDGGQETVLPSSSPSPPQDRGKWPRIINVGLRSSGMINGDAATPRIITLSSQISALAHSVPAPTASFCDRFLFSLFRFLFPLASSHSLFLSFPSPRAGPKRKDAREARRTSRGFPFVRARTARRGEYVS